MCMASCEEAGVSLDVLLKIVAAARESSLRQEVFVVHDLLHGLLLQWEDWTRYKQIGSSQTGERDPKSVLAPCSVNYCALQKTLQA